jgi:AraC family ethanolamine operon transcriptional activator
MSISSVLAEHSLPLSGLDVMNRLLDVCKLEAVALKEGALRGKYGGHRRKDASLCSFELDFPWHGRFALPNGYYLYCYVHHASVGSWCAGMPLLSDTALIVLPDSACEVMLSAHSSVTLLLAPVHAGVMRAVEKNADSFGPAERKFSVFQPERHVGTSMRSRYASVFRSLTLGTDHGAHAIGDCFFDSLLDASVMDDLLAHPSLPQPCSAGYGMSYRSFRRAVDFMRKNLHRDIYIDEMARAAGMSDRGLRYVFSDLLGVSPTRYLSLLRLHEAGRRLSRHEMGKLSIKAVAMSCGLWDLSRFSATYKQMFDEHPSATLLRACNYAA